MTARELLGYPASAARPLRREGLRKRHPVLLAFYARRLVRAPFGGRVRDPLAPRGHEVPPHEARPIQRRAADEHDPRGRFRFHADGVARRQHGHHVRLHPRALESVSAGYRAKVPMSKLDVEPIAAEAGITRARFYAYYTSKNDALAALIRRMIAARSPTYDHPDSWFVGRSPQVRPRAALRNTIERAIDVSWPHRFVLREACD